MDEEHVRVFYLLFAMGTQTWVELFCRLCTYTSDLNYAGRPLPGDQEEGSEQSAASKCVLLRRAQWWWPSGEPTCW